MPQAIDTSTTLEQRIHEHIGAKTVCTVESCTGGLIAHRITNVSGSSTYFLGGMVTYSNKSKIHLLGVDEATLDQFGAVSEPVVRQMAEGVRLRFGADFGVAVTGIAGPTGSTPDKPVGLVYIAVADDKETTVIPNSFSGSREEIKQQSANAALKLLMEQLR